MRRYPSSVTGNSFWKHYLLIRTVITAGIFRLMILMRRESQTLKKKKRDKERHAVLFGIAPERLIADYVSLLNGRNELERMIRHERPDGLLIKILTIVGRLVLKTAKFVKR